MNGRQLKGLWRRLKCSQSANDSQAFRKRMENEGVIVTDEHPRIVAATSFGKNCRIRTPIYMTNSSLDDWSYIEAYCRISHSQVGKFTAIAPGCHIGLAEHPSALAASSHPVFYRRDLSRGFDFADQDLRSETSPTIIGNDVWIGAGAIVKGGVTIGDGAIIGAGAVVTKNVPPYAIMTGVPASVRRYRFEAHDIDFLTGIRWWDWDIATLRKHFAAFSDISALRRLTEEVGVDTGPKTEDAAGHEGSGTTGGVRQ